MPPPPSKSARLSQSSAHSSYDGNAVCLDNLTPRESRRPFCDQIIQMAARPGGTCFQQQCRAGAIEPRRAYSHSARERLSALPARRTVQRLCLKPAVPCRVELRPFRMRVPILAVVSKDQKCLPTIVPSGSRRLAGGIGKARRLHLSHSRLPSHGRQTCMWMSGSIGFPRPRAR